MKKYSLREKISYYFDRLLSKNPLYMIILLFSFTFTTVLIVGTIAYFVSEDGGWFFQLWASLMHTIDSGALGGDSTDNIVYLLMMFLATLCGLFVTSILIGIISTSFETRLEDLKKGTSVVQVKNQTTIIGFNNNVYTLIAELIEANKNKKRAYIVVLGDAPKEEMEYAISSHIPKTYTTEIICRSGLLYESHSLELCSLQNSKSVIINTTEDSETVKILLAISAYLKDKSLYNKDLTYVTTMQDEANAETFRLASENKAILVHTHEAIARIIVNTCRQHGLSQVLTELFDFGGDEIYIESVPEMVGKTFKEALVSFENSSLIGIVSKGTGRLNPPMDTVINEGDGLVFIEEDDGAYKIARDIKIDENAIVENSICQDQPNENLVILGTNSKLPIILQEYDKYVHKGTLVTIVDEDFNKDLIGEYENIKVVTCNKSINREFLIDITKDADNVLLLNDDSTDSEKSDSITLVNLLLLRDITNNMGRKFSITTEMHHVENQKLADTIHVDDFVISSNFTSLIIAQLSEENSLFPIIDDLLDEDGAELYTKSASNYVKLSTPVNMYTLTKSASNKGEVLVGYRNLVDGKPNTVINPSKDTVVTFNEGDRIIVLADN